MSKRKSVLEDICQFVLCRGGKGIDVVHEGRQMIVTTDEGGIAHQVVAWPKSSDNAKELRENLESAVAKPVRTAIAGEVWLLVVERCEGSGRFRVRIEAAAEPDSSVTPRFTPKQGQYLAFIHSYTKIHRCAPSEVDMQRYFGTSAPSVHQMVRTLELNQLIRKTPGEARSIRLLVRPEYLPVLE